jgi:hypothetical protein
MILRLYVLTATVSALAMAGCQNDSFINSQIDTLGTEYRLLEDDFIALEHEYLAKCEELKACREGKGSGKSETANGDGQSGDESSGDSDDGDYSPPRIDFGTPGSPEIDFGTPIDPKDLEPGNSGGAGASPNDGASVMGPRDIEVSMPHIEEINYVEPTDKHITHIIVNPYLTAGHDFDSKPGDDGIALLVEPRNGDDRLVPVAGKLSIVVLDPALEGPASRVARWDFTAEEAVRRIKKGDDRRRGVSFKLPWPGSPPEHSKLHVFVRMESDDGKILEADSEFYVILPGQFSQRWTPSSQPGRATNQALVAKPKQSNYAVVPAQYTVERGEVGTGLLANATSVVKEDSPTNDRKAQSRAEKAASSSQPKRPVWTPYR